MCNPSTETELGVNGSFVSFTHACMNGDYKVVIFYDIQINTGEKITICHRIHLEVSSVNVILVFHWIEAWGSLFEKH